MSEFKRTGKTTITRLPKRGSYDKEQVYSILDECLFCSIAFVMEGQPHLIPTGLCRWNDQLYIHGSVGSTYMRYLVEKEADVCISATLLDGIVLARSAFHHSVNYRSVVAFGKSRKVTDPDELYRSLELFTEKMQAGRWNDVRKPTANEWKATMVIAFTIEEASAKIRTGPPKDDDEDYALDIWAGVIPMSVRRGTPERDPALKSTIALPSYLTF